MGSAPVQCNREIACELQIEDFGIKRKRAERKQRIKENKKNQNSIYELYIDRDISI